MTLRIPPRRAHSPSAGSRMSISYSRAHGSRFSRAPGHKNFHRCSTPMIRSASPAYEYPDRHRLMGTWRIASRCPCGRPDVVILPIRLTEASNLFGGFARPRTSIPSGIGATWIAMAPIACDFGR